MLVYRGYTDIVNNIFIFFSGFFRIQCHVAEDTQTRLNTENKSATIKLSLLANRSVSLFVSFQITIAATIADSYLFQNT
jgi:hypothetical protein